MKCVLLLFAAAFARANNECPPFPSTCVIDIPAGATLSVGTCILPGASCDGDTSIALYNKINQLLIQNDDGYNAAVCGYCSYLQYTNTDLNNAIITSLNQTCFANTSCNGTTVYAFGPLAGGGASAQSLNVTAPQPAPAGGGHQQSVVQTVTLQEPQTSAVLLVCAVIVTVAVVGAFVLSTMTMASTNVRLHKLEETWKRDVTIGL